MPGPLEDVVVVDLSRVIAGPQATMALADPGARVIKVEQPGTGDETRGWGPPLAGEGGVSTYYLSINRNKESITLDLKSGEGEEVLERLVRHADVLVENSRTGVLDRLGFPAERLQELNPRLIVLSITGFGHDGPEGGRLGYDAIMRGEAGIMSVTGPPGTPSKAGMSIADLLAAGSAAAGVPAASIRSIDEVYTWEQTRSQGLVIEVDRPTLGRIELPGPPLLGEHTAAVPAWLDERDARDEDQGRGQ